MSAISRFQEIAGQERFRGWPLVGEIEFGPKIPFFGQTINYKLRTGNGVEDYTSILRHFGWAVVFGVTEDDTVVTIVQWKPGTNLANWELPPGGIGKVRPGTPEAELRAKTQEFYLRETGYSGGNWEYLGHVMVESGKYRGASPEDHGLPAHLYLATKLRQTAEARKPNGNEIMENLLVPLAEFDEVIDSGLFKECSAVPCALLALRRLSKRGVLQ